MENLRQKRKIFGSDPRGATCNIHGGGVRRNFILRTPKKYMCLKFYTQKNTWHQNFLPKKIQDLAPRH